MEALVLVINDEFHIDISDFSETIINADRMDFSHPEVHASISNFNIDLSFLHDIVIKKLSVLRNDIEIWHSAKYTSIERLEFIIDNIGARYTLAII